MKVFCFIFLVLLYMAPIFSGEWDEGRLGSQNEGTLIFTVRSIDNDNFKYSISGNAIEKYITFSTGIEGLNGIPLVKYQEIVYKWDNDRPQSFFPKFPLDGITSFNFPGDFDDWISKMRESEVLQIKALAEDGSIITMTFDVTGFEELVTPHLEELWWW